MLTETLERNDEEEEWSMLAAIGVDLRHCGVKHADKAHPLSYRADLPLRSELKRYARYKDGMCQTAKRWTLTAAEKKALAARPLQFTPKVPV